MAGPGTARHVKEMTGQARLGKARRGTRIAHWGQCAFRVSVVQQLSDRLHIGAAYPAALLTDNGTLNMQKAVTAARVLPKF